MITIIQARRDASDPAALRSEQAEARTGTLRTVTAMRFTLRQLEYFVATCEVGSVTEAAQNIPVAQSSVSAAIRQLEVALGVQLLIRHHAQGISTTPAGQRFLLRARALLREAEELERFASELTENLSGTLALGCLVTLAPLVTPQLCHTFGQRNPDVSTELLTAGQAELLARLRDGGITLALTYDLQLEDDVAFEPLVELPPYAQFSAEHPLARRERVTVAELAREPLVLLDLPYSRDYFRALFAHEGLEPNIAQRSAQPEVVRTLVANGFGYGIVNARPRAETALDGSELLSVPIDGEVRPMVLGLASLEVLRDTRVAAAFREHCRACITPAGVPGLKLGAQA